MHKAVLLFNLHYDFDANKTRGGKKLKMQMPNNVMKIGILRFGEIWGRNTETHKWCEYKFFARGSRAIMVISMMSFDANYPFKF